MWQGFIALEEMIGEYLIHKQRKLIIPLQKNRYKENVLARLSRSHFLESRLTANTSRVVINRDSNFLLMTCMVQIDQYI